MFFLVFLHYFRKIPYAHGYNVPHHTSVLNNQFPDCGRQFFCFQLWRIGVGYANKSDQLIKHLSEKGGFALFFPLLKLFYFV